MSLSAMALAVALHATPASSTLPMPPTPKGMVLLTPQPASAITAAAESPKKPKDDEDDSDAEEPVQNKDSQELEEMRALEEATVDPQSKGSAAKLTALERLGAGNPLRARLEDTLGDDALGEDGPQMELGRITDLLRFDVATVAHEYDIPVEMQPLVAQYIQFFQGPGRKWFRKWMDRSTRFLPLMQPILQEHGVPKDLVYLSMIESGFSTQAYSWAKASGPWQFIGGTAKLYDLKNDFWVDERRDPVKATHAAARYLHHLYGLFGDWYLSWAGYNAGSERVRKVMVKKETKDFWQMSDGKGFAKETKHYVPKLIACALVAKHPSAFGFDPAEFEYEQPREWDEVKVVDPTDLEVIARAAGVPVDEVKELNPELRRWCTPPATEAKPYTLKLPKGSAAAFAENFPKVAPKERLTFKVHHIKKGDTLSAIAHTYHTAPEAILALNQLKSAKRLRVNSDLVIPVAPGKGGMDGADVSASLERQVVKARRAGYVAPRPEDEVAAGTPRAPSVQGPITTDKVDGKAHLTYGVADGDNLWSIGQRFDVSVDDLKKWNHLSKKVKGLQIGTVLSIFPGTKAAPTVENHSGTLVARASTPPAPVVASATTAGSSNGKKTHLLAAGETLWSVAQKYGVSVDDLKKWNGIKKDRAVKAGQELVLVSP